MNVYIVRHAQSRQNVNDPENHPFLPEVAEYEDHDFSLTELGEQQADLVGQRLAQKELKTILCSPLHRHMSTANGVIRYQKNKTVELINDLFEKGIHSYAGMPLELMQKLFPDMNIIPCPNPTPTGGKYTYTIDEMYDKVELRERARRVVNYIINRFDDEDTILIISSGDFMSRYLIACLLDLPDELVHRSGFGCTKGSIGKIVIEKKKNRRSCAFLNDTAHLELGHGNIPLK